MTEHLADLALLLALGILLAAKFVPPPARAGEASPPQQPSDRPSPLRVSPETTSVTGPLREDGSVDFTEAINQRLRQDVTPENNAAVPFVRAIGPMVFEGGLAEEVPEETTADFFRRLGVAPLPEESSYLIALETYVGRLLAASPEGLARKTAKEVCEDAGEQLNSAIARPWTAEQYPMLAGWLEANEAPLRLISEATRRSRWYWPLPTTGGRLYDSWAVSNTSIVTGRFAARVLSCRAMFHLGLGDVDAAQADLLSIFRLARLIGQEPFVVSALASYAVESVAIQGMASLAHYADYGPDQVRAFTAELEKLPERRPLAKIFGFDERLFALSSFDELGDVGPFMLRSVFTVAEDLYGPTIWHRWWLRGQRFASRVAARYLIDWNEVARQFNAWTDRVAKATDIEELAEREAAFAALKREREEDRSDRVFHITSRLLLGASPRRVATDSAGATLKSLVFGAYPAVNQAHNRLQVQRQMTPIVLALGAFRSRHGRYPENLESLVPDYLDRLAEDPYGDGPYKYRCTAEGCRVYSVGPNGEDDGGRNATVEWQNDGLPAEADDACITLPRPVDKW